MGLIEQIDEVIEMKLKVAEEYIEHVIGNLGKLPKPEEITGKPYGQWSAEDMAKVEAAYGREGLEKIIAKKEVAELEKMEAE